LCNVYVNTIHQTDNQPVPPAASQQLAQIFGNAVGLTHCRRPQALTGARWAAAGSPARIAPARNQPCQVSQTGLDSVSKPHRITFSMWDPPPPSPGNSAANLQPHLVSIPELRVHLDCENAANISEGAKNVRGSLQRPTNHGQGCTPPPPRRRSPRGRPVGFEGTETSRDHPVKKNLGKKSKVRAEDPSLNKRHQARPNISRELLLFTGEGLSTLFGQT
jgi:hypothetical protein